MQMWLRFTICITLSAVLCVRSVGQEMTKAERKAVEKATALYDEALSLKAKRHYKEACAAMEQSIALRPGLADAYSMLGQWYFEGHDFAKAAETFRRGTYKCLNGKIRFAKPLARSLVYAGEATEAVTIIGNYATICDSADWNRLRRQALFVKSAMAKSNGLWPANLGSRVNSPVPELFPSMAVDTQYLFFTRRVGNMDEELYYAEADSCDGWFAAINVGPPVNSPSQESAQFVSADGHYLFYCRCENRSENGWDEGGCDLFMAYRVHRDSGWTVAQPFGRTINNTSYEGMPSLSPDNRELYFVSDREGGFGGYDIWVSKFDNGLWQKPVNAGAGVNTRGNETTPFIAGDNKTLYFASDERMGMGGTDIFVSKRQADGSWGTAENLGYPINTANDEKSEYVSLDGQALFFASDRNGPAGNFDIYRVPMSGAGAPSPVGYLQGYVIDSISREQLNAAEMVISELHGREKLYELRSNRGDGSYVVTLEPGHTYVIHTDRFNYQPKDDTVVFGKEFSGKPLHHDVSMLTLDYNPLKPIDDSLIATVHFDVYVTELTDEYKSVLLQALAPWKDEEGITFYVNAYTDNTGTPMINEELSFKRARTVAHQLFSSGFPKASVVAKGWGEANPIASNETEEGQYENRRVEIIVRR